MGILLDGKFWGDTLNQLEALRPPLGKPISKSDAEKIRATACKALSRLVEDPEFSADIEKVTKQEAELPKWTTGPDFEGFLNRFMQVESKILADAGTNSVVSRDLEREIRSAPKISGPQGFEKLKEKIELLKRLACEPNAAANPARPTWEIVWKGVKGMGLIGIDAASTGGAALVFGPFGAGVAGAVVGISMGYGWIIVNDAIKGHW